MKTFSELRTLNERKIVEKKATTYIEEGAEVYTMKKGPYTRKVDGKEADKMKRQGWKLIAMMRETLDEAYQQFLDKSPSNWGEEKVVAYGTKKGYKVIGVCGHGRIDGMVLFGLDASDKSYVGKEAKVKTGQTVFRYATRNSMAGDIFPLVKIDVKKGLLYNLSQKSSDGEVDYAEFESKGIKLRYLRLAATANLRDITGFDPGFSSMKESVDLEEALKTTHVVIDTADGNRIVSSATNEKQAKYSVVSAERPPMNIKDKKTLKVVQLKKPVSLNKDILGTVFKESVDLEEGKMKEFHGYIDQGKSAQWIAKKMGLDMKTVKALMDDIKESTDLSEAIDFEKMSKELLKHKSKGIEFEKAAAFVRVMFMNSASSVQDKAMKGLLDLLKNMDDLTKKTTITKILKDNGFKVKGGRIMREESVQEAKDDDYRRLTHAIKTTPKHRRDKVAMASQPAKTDLKAVARRKAIEKHQERMRAKKDSY